MEITCGSCSTNLRIPDDRLPKGVPVVNANCPKCQYPMEIRIPQPGDAPAAAAAEPAPAAEGPRPVPGPPPSPSPDPAPEPPPPAPIAARPPAPLPRAQEEPPAPPPVVEDFSEERKLAMACFSGPELTALVKQGLEAAGYSVHLPVKSADALHWLRRGKYELVLIHDEFDPAFLKSLQPMAMSMRRHLCIGLAGKTLKTMDNMAAFAHSVNFTVAERELDKIKGIGRQALADNDQFYRIFREALHDAGKA